MVQPKGDNKAQTETQPPRDHNEAPFRSATAATMRALAGRRGIDVEFVDVRGSADGDYNTQSRRASITPDNSDASTRALSRAESDTKALHMRYHDDALHQAYLPDNEAAAQAFNALEQARCEALGAKRLKGVQANLSARLAEDCRRKGYAELSARDESALADALHALGRAALSGEELPESARPLAEHWQPWLDSRLGEDGMHRLAAAMADQERFAQQAGELLAHLDMPVREGDDTEFEEESETSDKDDSQDTSGDEASPDNSADNEEQDSTDDRPEDAPGNQARLQQSDVAESENEMADMAEQQRPAGPQGHRPEGYSPDPVSPYRIYTDAFDEVVRAEKLARASDLARLRANLDQQLTRMQNVVRKLANRLQRKLMARQQRGWRFEMEKGYLDPAKLAQMVANPNTDYVFKQEQETDFQDTIVTLLLDNSGSMRGRPITMAAMCADIIARTLERCEVKVEILGFTTRAWKGGRARELWQENGRPPSPGRLNDLRHIIYKGADQPYRRTRRNLGLMLKEGLLKENIDGEALAWAHNRLMRRPEQRRILMVISDGAPVDDSTLSVNESGILEADLRNMIAFIERKTPIELTAIGIGHDVTRYYQRAMTITDVDALGPALIERLDQLFESPRGYRR